TGRVLTGRAGGREASDGGELEALWEVADRKAAFAEQAFGLRAGEAATQLGDAGQLVEGMQLVEPTQVERDHRAEAAALGVEPTGDVGATAERNHRNAVLGAVAEDRGDGVVVSGQQYRVGRILDAGVLAPQHVWGGLAAGAQQPVAVRGAEVLRADDAGQRV